MTRILLPKIGEYSPSNALRLLPIGVVLSVLLLALPANCFSAENPQNSPKIDHSGKRDFVLVAAQKRKRRYVKAKVIKTSYKKERSLFGNWRGRVLGDGKTHLFLRFIQNGRVIARRLIGRIELDNEPNGVFFSYRGAVPRKRHLRWDIVAFSEK